ncbi:MAG: hypothetical protein Pg6C_04280 [Treponemataceae bacterium]|nr:MAG: hypothetical protein Pg6C_04280 [Treponemataceae bacterium]
MVIEQIVEIQGDHRLVIDLPPELPVGRAQAAVTLIFEERKEMPAEAEKTWTWNRAHRQEVKDMLLKLRGSLSPASFGGMDGVSYQRKVRAEWDGA